MISVIIPFFLATRLAVNESVWPYGPEYVFRSTIRASYDGWENGTDVLKMNMTNDVSCRPRMMYLSCLFKTTDVYIQNVKQEESSVEKRIWIPPKQFEMVFDKSGIKYYIAAKNFTESHQLKLIKMLTNGLSVGYDLSNEADVKFKKMKRTFYGDCQTEYELKRSSNEDDSDEQQEKEDEKIDFELISSLNRNTVQDVRIKMCTKTEDCSDLKIFVFGFLGIEKLDSDTPMKMESYCSEMHILKDKFVTNTEVKLTAKVNELDVNITEEYLLELVDIHPATDEVGLLEEPVMSPVSAYY